MPLKATMPVFPLSLKKALSMSEPNGPSTRLVTEERLGRSLLMSVFLIFCSFAIVIGWNYEGENSEAAKEPTSPVSSVATEPAASPTAVIAASPATPSPTGTPSATSFVAPASPSATPMSTPTPTPTMTLLERAVAVESSLRSGQLEAALKYGEDTQSTVWIAFDLVDGAQAPRLHFKYAYQYSYTYTDLEEVHLFELERIVVGNRIWSRRLAGIWVEQPQQDDAVAVAERSLGRFLPHVDGALEVTERVETPGVLRWYDAQRDADVVLELDPATAVPIRLTQVERQSGATLVVTYTGWNAGAEIAPPGE